ncbi:hypothetical protein [Cupriavidus plantarum]|uniref:hypothetical protein n=1 Tax=Cupriavidus plantarum TaxID=942865 RepID=UPI001BAB5502|nr:hypothetical protein [Cupriavidus plantarum]
MVRLVCTRRGRSKLRKATFVKSSSAFVIELYEILLAEEVLLDFFQVVTVLSGGDDYRMRIEVRKKLCQHPHQFVGLIGLLQLGSVCCLYVATGVETAQRNYLV